MPSTCCSTSIISDFPPNKNAIVVLVVQAAAKRRMSFMVVQFFTHSYRLLVYPQGRKRKMRIRCGLCSIAATSRMTVSRLYSASTVSTCAPVRTGQSGWDRQRATTSTTGSTRATGIRHSHLLYQFFYRIRSSGHLPSTTCTVLVPPITSLPASTGSS